MTDDCSNPYQPPGTIQASDESNHVAAVLIDSIIHLIGYVVTFGYVGAIVGAAMWWFGIPMPGEATVLGLVVGLAAGFLIRPQRRSQAN